MISVEKDCLFCKLSSDGGVASPVYSDADFFCLKDIRPKAPLHVLLIPHRHFQNVISLYNEDLALYRDFFEKATQLTRDHFKKEECKYLLNTGKTAGQEIDHVHLHIMSWS
jgi:histidine triad (HIT) family protein